MNVNVNLITSLDLCSYGLPNTNIKMIIDLDTYRGTSKYSKAYTDMYIQLYVCACCCSATAAALAALGTRQALQRARTTTEPRPKTFGRIVTKSPTNEVRS